MFIKIIQGIFVFVSIFALYSFSLYGVITFTRKQVAKHYQKNKEVNQNDENNLQ